MGSTGLFGFLWRSTTIPRFHLVGNTHSLRLRSSLGRWATVTLNSSTVRAKHLWTSVSSSSLGGGIFAYIKRHIEPIHVRSSRKERVSYDIFAFSSDARKLSGETLWNYPVKNVPGVFVNGYAEFSPKFPLSGSDLVMKGLVSLLKGVCFCHHVCVSFLPLERYGKSCCGWSWGWRYLDSINVLVFA